MQPVENPEAFQKEETWCPHLRVPLSYGSLVKHVGFQTSMAVLLLKVAINRMKCIRGFQQ